MNPKILIAPLNWGLGHAARCIPIIRSLIERGHKVCLGSDGEALQFLCKEFPAVEFFELAGLDIKYPLRARTVFWIRKAFSLSKWIREDNRKIAELCHWNSFSHIISDNRYGANDRSCHNIFLTHQLHLQLPFPWAALVSNYINRYISNFDLCLIPDFRSEPNLCGNLSHPPPSVPEVYLGPISRFKSFKSDTKYDVVAIISGPEPYRSIFEKKVTDQLISLDFKALIVCGRQGTCEIRKLTNFVSKVDFFTSSALNKAISQSDILVSRAGYTSIMDYHCLNKKALLIPTPGQPEQQYLAYWNQNHPLFLFQSETDLDIARARDMLMKRSFRRTETEKDETLNQVFDNIGL